MITGIGHVAIRCRDLEKSAAFYIDVLGMKEAFRMENDQGQTNMFYVIMAKEVFLELFPNGTEEYIPGPNTIGMVHLCLQVEDAEKALETLREKGAPIDREISIGRSGCKQFWTHDPDGNKIELMELLSTSKQYKATQEF